LATPLSSAANVVFGVGIKTALGDDRFVLRSFRYRESLGEPFEAVVDGISDDGKVDLKALLGTSATVRVPLPAGGKRYFSGIVLEARQTGRSGDTFGYRLMLVSWLRLLGLASDCRIFQNKTVKDVLQDVFSRSGFSAYEVSGIVGNLPKLEFCVQYDETHRNFVDRLAQRFGIAYHAKHADGSHKVVFHDSHTALQPFPGYDKIRYAVSASPAGEEHVFRWESGVRMTTGKVAIKDYDFKNPQSNLIAEESAGHSYPMGSLERFEYPGFYSEQADGETLAKIRMGEQACEGAFFSGKARCYGLSAGSTFKLEGHPRDDQNASYLTTAIDLVIEPVEEASSPKGRGVGFSCTCSFEAMPADVDYRPPRTARVPRIDGVQTAVVVGPAGQDQQVPYTDEYASVRVQFHWDRQGQDNEKSSCWLRHAQVFAGSGWGATFLPLVGCEVVVAFIGGDPDRPMVLGGVYNGNHKPPRELPGQAVKTVIQDVAGNLLALDSTEGKESLSMRSVYQNMWIVLGEYSVGD